MKKACNLNPVSNKDAGRLQNQRAVFLIIIFALILTLLPRFTAVAGVRDDSQQDYLSSLIIKEITPERVYTIDDRIKNSSGKDAAAKQELSRLSKKTVFWTGRVVQFVKQPSNIWMLVKSDRGTRFWVFAEKNQRNLEFDRKWFRISVKGSIILKDGRMSYLKTKSVVITAAPPHFTVEKFSKKYNLTPEFEMNTANGTVKITNRYYPFIAHRIYIHNPDYSIDKIKQIAASIIYYCHKYPVDPLLVTALLNVESSFDVDAISRSGAVGLGQLMPATAAGMGVDPYDPVQNVGGAVRYLYGQMQQWNSSAKQVSLALASYNAGPGAVERCGDVPQYSETKNYVFLITYIHHEFQRQCGDIISSADEIEDLSEFTAGPIEDGLISGAINTATDNPQQLDN